MVETKERRKMAAVKCNNCGLTNRPECNECSNKAEYMWCAEHNAVECDECSDTATSHFCSSHISNPEPECDECVSRAQYHYCYNHRPEEQRQECVGCNDPAIYCQMCAYKETTCAECGETDGSNSELICPDCLEKEIERRVAEKIKELEKKFGMSFSEEPSINNSEIAVEGVRFDFA